MLIYFILIGISGLFLLILTSKGTSYANVINESTTERRMYFQIMFGIAAFGLFFIYILRGDSVGVDYSMYHGFMYLGPDTLQNLGIESGYIKLYAIAKHFDNFLIVGTVSYFFFFFGMYRLMRSVQISRFTFLSLYILSYSYFISFNTIRQMAALGIVCFGLSIFNQRDTLDVSLYSRDFLKSYVAYVLWVFIASLFHTSALLAVVIPITMRIRATPKRVLFAFLLVSFGYFTEFASVVIPKLSVLFPHYLQKYERTQESFFAAGDKGAAAFIPIFIQFVILFVILNYDPQFSRKFKSVTSGYLMYLLLFIGGGNAPILRTQGYWLPFIILFVGRYLQYSPKDEEFRGRSIMKVLLISFWIVYASSKVARNISGIVPYIIR